MQYKIARFDIVDILPIALTFVVAGIGIAYGLNVLGDLSNDYIKSTPLSATCNTTINGGTGNVRTGCGAEYNATQNTVVGVAKLPDKFPLIINVVVAAIIIGILIRYLMVRYG